MYCTVSASQSVGIAASLAAPDEARSSPALSAICEHGMLSAEGQAPPFAEQAADCVAGTRAHEPPSPLQRMSTAVLGFLSDLGRGSQGQNPDLRAQDGATDGARRTPEQMLATVIAQVREFAGSLDEDKLAQLEKDIAGSLLRATADSGASSPKTGGGGQASLARPSSSAAPAGAVRV